MDNVLLIVIDAMRADHTSVFGHDRDTTPNLRSLSADAHVFENAFAAAPWTPPSHASMFSGVHPSTHGYLDGGMPYNPPHQPLAEHFRDDGYATFGAAMNAKIGNDTEIRRGFDEYNSFYRLPFVPESVAELQSYYLDPFIGYLRMARDTPFAGRKTAETIVGASIERNIRRHAGRNPFFGFTNIGCPHSPYAPPRRFRKLYETDRPGADPDRVEDLSDRGGYRFMGGELNPTEGDWAKVKDLYDSETAFADEIIGDIIDTLRKVGAYDDTMLIVTADHGEHFGEHGRAYHQFSLFDELLHVPLIIKPPRSEEGSRREELASLVDLYPTVLSQLGMPVPETVEGRDLFAPGSREHVFAEYGEPITAITSLKNNMTEPVDDELLSELSYPLRCVRTQTQKCIRAVGGDDYLYEFTSGSPKESLVETNPGGALPKLVSEHLSGSLEVESQSLDDPDIRRNLEDLGYL